MSDTQLIKDKIDVVTLVGEYVALKPAGINHKGLCPFHREKSPSFMVNRERQNWHCFGCGKGGDIFSFVQEIEGMEFREALQFLAQRAGVTLTERPTTGGGNTNQKSQLKDIMAEAARFYHKVLTELPAAQAARDYLLKRGLKSETIEAWQIGFVPDQWELLTQYLFKKGFGVDDLVASGLTIKREGAQAGGRGFYDRFRGRIMFPIWDVHDTVVGFTGRVLVETENSGGKYVNTPQTALYDKSRVVFGLNKAKAAIREQGFAVMVEGQMDVIACHQAGMTNVVATSGTAMTEWQISLLKRYAPTILIAFDGDSAGQQAAERGIDLARSGGLAVKVIRLAPEAGKDADEALQKNPQAWWDAVKQASDIMEWYLQRGLNANMSDPRARQEAMNYVLQKIVVIPYAVERDFWLRELAGRTGEDIAVLRENIKELKQTGAGPIKAKPVESEPVSQKPAVLPRHSQLAERWLVLGLKFPKSLVTFCQNPDPAMEVAIQTTQHLAPLYEAIKTQYTATAGLDVPSLREVLYDQTAGAENLVDVLLMRGELDFFGLQEPQARLEMSTIQQALHQDWLKSRRSELVQALTAAEKVNDSAAIQRLLTELQNLH